MSNKQAKNKDKKKNVKFYEPDKSLKIKVGPTPFKKETVEKADKELEKNEIDFEPMAKDALQEMRQSIDKARQGKGDPKELVDELTKPVMQLKANAATFKYPLITQLMNILLNFLETLDDVNKDVIAITEINHKAVRTVLAHKMKGDTDKRGDLLVRELGNVIQRYRKKHQSVK